MRRPPFLYQKIYAAFDEKEGVRILPGLCLELLTEQKKVWQGLREGYELLGKVKERDVSCMGFSVRLQQNPGRIKSSLADVGERNAKGQECFLCVDHLIESQRGILYRNDYLILCNPMPIFSPHFTVSHLDHRRQAITEHIDAFLRLMTDLGSGWMVLYNGPKCGASAPDHLHFQVNPSRQMPIEGEIREKKRLTLMRQVKGVSVRHLSDVGREVILLEGLHPAGIREAFRSFLNALKGVLLVDEEPMMNVAGFREGREWHLMIFPRRKHRPDAFFQEGDARVVVSPGVVDMGGLLITPVEKDFRRLDAAAVEGIYREVSLEEKTVKRAIDGMR